MESSDVEPAVSPEISAQDQIEKEKAVLNKRLETAAWGSFLILIGAIWLVPESILPQSTWLIVAGVILLGLNAVRYFKGIKINGFTVFLGGLALLSGVGGLVGWDVPVLPIAVIIIGLSLIFGSLFKKS